MKIKKIFATVLSLAMIFTMAPATASAAGNEEAGSGRSTVSQNGLTLTKNATLEDDGTYTIDLEAYATGSVTTIPAEGMPLDIVLVVDQSGSMAYDDGGQSTSTEENRRMYKLQNAVRGFVDSISQNAEDYNVDHRIAIAGYASDEDAGPSTTVVGAAMNGDNDEWVNTGLYINGTFKNYGETTTTEEDYTEIYGPDLNTWNTYYISENGQYRSVSYSSWRGSWGYSVWGMWQEVEPKTSANDTNWGHVQFYELKRETITTPGLTNEDYQAALVSVNNYNEDAEGNRVASINPSITQAIDLFKASGGTYTEYGLQMAENIFDNNSATYTDPEGQPGTRKRIVVLFTDGETNSNVETVLDHANDLKDSYSADVYCVGFGSEIDTDFLSYVSSNYLNSSSSWVPGGWFENGHYEYTGTYNDNKYSMTANNSAELEEIFENISEDIQNPTADVDLDANAVMKDVMGTGFKIPDNYNVRENVSISTVNGSYNNGDYSFTTENPSPAGISAKVNGSAIEVTGFDYAENFVGEGHNGAKLVVQIRGILPTEEAVINEAVVTNDMTSGIYAAETPTTPAATFPQPQTILTSKAYVLDYAKETSLTGFDQNVTSIVDNMRAVTAADTSATGTYGDSSLSASSISYTPKTTNWDGYDNIYAFGKTSDTDVTKVEANANGNLWSRISVIPANNVYYEDDFVTNEADGTVGIKYSGDWETAGTPAGNTETADNDVHGGWTEGDGGLSDDGTYSDGSVHVGTSGASASFTFSGTGVDVYSRTNNLTGTIAAVLTGGPEGNTVSKFLAVDNYADSGDYYQIPTVSFSGLAYGEYNLTIYVTNAADTRATYYLDGIRVYNSIQDQESDEIVQGAYGEDELNAVFTGARELLQSGNMAFIDEDADGNAAAGDYTESEIGKLAPKNEIYLGKGQYVVLKTDNQAGKTYYIGLKAPEGMVNTEVTNGNGKSSVEINHSTDLYYKVTPAVDGTIVVKNTSDNLLSITKIREAGAGETGIVENSLTPEMAVSAVNTFNTAAYIPYQTETVTDDTGSAGEGDVEIDNPDGFEDEGEQTQPAERPNPVRDWITGLINGIKNLFFSW